MWHSVNCSAFSGRGEHDVEHDLFENGAQAAGAGLHGHRLARNFGKAPSSVKCSSTESSSKSFWYCLTIELRGRVRISIISRSPQLVQRGHHGEPAQEFGDHAELEQGRRSRLAPAARQCGGSCAGASRAPKPITRWLTRRSMIFSKPLNAPPQMNRMFRVSIWMYSWCGCFAAAGGRNVGQGAFQDLEQRLLYALATHVAGDGDVLRGCGRSC